MKQYKDLFFDLDHTLWDFEKNSGEALLELYDSYKLAAEGVPSAAAFKKIYKEVNYRYWSDYREGKVSQAALRVGRFRDTLAHFGLDNVSMADKMGLDYIGISPYKTHLFPHAMDVLEQLKGNYRMHIITNGFEEVQHIKLRESGLRPFFDQIITSEKAGAKKPSSIIFDYAFRQAVTKPADSLMIGDNIEVDCLGAEAQGMDSVFFNPLQQTHAFQVSHEISCLSELSTILL